MNRKKINMIRILEIDYMRILDSLNNINLIFNRVITALLHY